MSKTCDYTLVWKNTFHRPGVVPIPGHDGRFRYIYKITNIHNKKVYVGQHKVRMKFNNDPIKDHYKGSGVLLTEDYKTFNFNNDFSKEIIEYCNSDEELNEREIFYVDQLLNSNVDCYNVSTGGIGWKDAARNNSKKNTGIRVVIIFDFTSPLNNISFKAGTVFENQVVAGREVGFKNRTSFNVSIINHPTHPNMWFVHNREFDCITCFHPIKSGFEVSDEWLKEKQEYYKKEVERVRTSHKQVRLEILEKARSARKFNKKKK